MKYIFGLVIFIAIASVNVLAQDAPPMPPGGQPGGMRMQFQMPNFAELDKNKDKKISREEFPSQFPAQAFDRLDTNHDGFIDEEEWNAMRNRFAGSGAGGGAGGGMGGGPRTGESLTKLLDANTDGKISRDEFAKLVSLFDILDKDHNGELSPEELNGFFGAVREAQTQATGGVEVNNLFEKYDKNKDGKITADEIANDKIFKSLDLNKDGAVTREEADTAIKQIKKAADAKKGAQTPNN